MKIISFFWKTHQLYLVLMGLIVFFSALSVNKYLLTKPNIQFSREKHAVNFNSSLNYTHFGLKRFFTAILWIKTLLDSDLERNFNKNSNSWIYFRFLTISELDPRFIENYQLGGQYLSIIKDDLVGAELIYKRGIKYYPNDYFLNYNLAFLYFNEVNDYKSALPYLLKIKDFPQAPPFIIPLIATMMQKDNVDLQYIIDFTKDALEKHPKDIFYSILENKLKTLESLQQKK